MGKLALRNPSVPASVVPIFRYDHTQVPNFIFEKFLVNHKSGLAELKVVLYLIYLMDKTGDEEIIVGQEELATLLDMPRESVRDGIKNAVRDGILTISSSDIKVGGNFINAYKLVNPVNFKR